MDLFWKVYIMRTLLGVARILLPDRFLLSLLHQLAGSHSLAAQMMDNSKAECPRVSFTVICNVRGTAG